MSVAMSVLCDALTLWVVAGSMLHAQTRPSPSQIKKICVSMHAHTHTLQVHLSGQGLARVRVCVCVTSPMNALE